MPRVNRKSKSRVARYDELDFELLLHGSHGVPCMLEMAYQAGDDESIRQAWSECRSQLLPAWIRNHPGTRPWGWWRHEAPEHRRRVDGKPHPFEYRPRILYVANSGSTELQRAAYRTAWGLPTCFIPGFDDDLHADFFRHGCTGRESSIFEGEWELLQRHGLLIAGADTP